MAKKTKDPENGKPKTKSDVSAVPEPLERVVQNAAPTVTPETMKGRRNPESVPAAERSKPSGNEATPKKEKPARTSTPRKNAAYGRATAPPRTPQQPSAPSESGSETAKTPVEAVTQVAAMPTFGLPAATDAELRSEPAPVAERHLFVPETAPALHEPSGAVLTDTDIYLFNEGTHTRLYMKLGSHPVLRNGVEATYFAVWAPNAERVSVFGDFNGWDKGSSPLLPRGNSGIWEAVIEGAHRGSRYKYHVVSRFNGFSVDKADPFAVMHETPPLTASVVWDLDYQWNDAEWMRGRGQKNPLRSPVSIYEMHVGSWMRNVDENRSLTYRELASELPRYLKELGFTHVEFMPVMEHPFFGSWGYQVTGFFAPSSRFGTPQDLMFLIDALHQEGIGVILDWVPSHFPTDEHGLAYFDGTHLFEHADPRQGFHPDWQSLIFNYGRNEVRSFLLSSSMFWLERFHADGLRVDAVASMLYLDYSRKHGEWIPNKYGGRENLDAVSFLRRMNEDAYGADHGIITIAEESTAWPMVSRPSYIGGLGFGMKWDMGWMHDTLKYMAHEPIHRKFHHNSLTFRMMYAYTENFVLPLSHDEVVHGKGSLLNKMPGDSWQKFANLRLLYAYMFAQPGKKLLFMGGEFGQWREWNHDSSLDWHLFEHPMHAGLARWVKELNTFYVANKPMHELDTMPGGFEWIDCNDSEHSVVSCLRRDEEGHPIIGVFNFTPVVRYNYRVGAPEGGWWRELLNSDGREYGGSGQGNLGRIETSPLPVHGRPFSLPLTLPPLGAVFFEPEPSDSFGSGGA